MVTIREIYRLALARVFDAPGADDDYDTYSPLLLDSLLAEALPYENNIRLAHGRTALQAAPRVQQIDDAMLDWDEQITRVALPYGLAAVILADDELRKSESLVARNEYIAALEGCCCGVEQSAEGWG